MNMTCEKYLDLLRRIEACPDVTFTIDSNDTDLAAEIVEVLSVEFDA